MLSTSFPLHCRSCVPNVYSPSFPLDELFAKPMPLLHPSAFFGSLRIHPPDLWTSQIQAPPPNDRISPPQFAHRRTHLSRNHVFQRCQELPRLVIPAMARPTLRPLGRRDRALLRGEITRPRRPQQLRVESPLVRRLRTHGEGRSASQSK